MRPGAAVSTLLVVAACSPSGTIATVDWPDDLDVGFVMVFDGETTVSRYGPLLDRRVEFDIEDGRVARLLGWSTDDLRALSPSLDEARLTDVELLPEPESCAVEGRLLEDRVRERWPVPATTRVYETTGDGLESDSIEPWRSWSVIVPMGGGRCASTWDSAATLFDVRENLPPRGARRVARVSEDVLVSHIRRAASFLVRGETYTETPATRIDADSFGADFSQMAVYEDRLFLGLSYLVAGASDAEAGAVLEVELTPAGFGRRTLSDRFPGDPRGMAIDANGRFLIAAETNVVTGTSATLLRQHPREGAPNVSAVATRDDSLPHVLGGDVGFVAESDYSLSPPVEMGDEALALTSNASVRYVAAGPRPGQLWTAYDELDGRVISRRDGVWEELRFDLPAGYEDCSYRVDDCGRTRLGAEPGVIPSDPPVLMAPSCGGLFVIDSSLDCLIPVELPAPREMLISSSRSAQSLDDGRVTIGTDSGLILELDP